MYFIFDTETNNLVNRKADYAHSSQPDVVQAAAVLYDRHGAVMSQLSAIVYPEKFTIAPPMLQNYPGLTIEEVRAKKLPFSACDVNGVTHERALEEGVDAKIVLSLFNAMAAQAQIGIAHNADFDVLAMETMGYREDVDLVLPDQIICTMKSTTEVCKIPPWRYGSHKWPTLQELHVFLFGEEFEGAHDALVDVLMCGKCFFELRRRGLVDQWVTL